MALVQILSNIAQFLLVVGVSFAVLTLIASVIRFQHIARKASEPDEAIDPHDLFQVEIANRLGTVHLEPEPFLVMILGPGNLPPGVELRNQKAVEAFLDAIEGRLKKMLRGTDTVVHIGGSQIGVVVDAARGDAEGIARRLLDEVFREPVAGVPAELADLDLSMGVSTHPENGTRVRTLMEAATTALHDALHKGPGRFVLTAGGETPGDDRESAREGTKEAEREPLSVLVEPDRMSIALPKYIAQYRKQEHPVSTLVFGVDHFERYGEHYGASTGEMILRQLGEFLQNAVRVSDLVGLADERSFLIAMPCAPAEAMIAAQRLVNAVKRRSFPAGDSNLRVTCCAGVAGYPDHGGHPRQLVDAATSALEAAQDNGRGMCLMYEPSMRPARNRGGSVERF